MGSGGEKNVASGQYSSVPGGKLNTASGDYSFAMGYSATAEHQHSYVVNFSTDDDFASTKERQVRFAADEFNIAITNSLLALEASKLAAIQRTLNDLKNR